MSTEVIEDIEHQYMPSRWIKRHSDDVVKDHETFCTVESNHVRKTVPHTSGLKYGQREGQICDIFGEDYLLTGAEIFVYIHGGYWQSLNRETSSYCVKPLYEAGITTVIPDYDLAPAVRIETIVLEIKELANYVFRLADQHKCRGVWFSGHSAGAHLAAQFLSSSFLETLSKPHKVLFKGLILISGIYDLSSLIYTSVNQQLKLTSKDIQEFSPLLNENQILKVEDIDIKVFIACGEFDPPAFHKQAERLSEILKLNSVDTTYIKILNEDHFSIVENLKEPKYELMKKIIKLIKTH